MVGVNVPIPVPVAYYSFGGWKNSLFGDLHIYGPGGDPVLHAREGRHLALARPGDLEGRPGLPADSVIVGVALFDGAEELDWAGPWEVLAAWAEQWPDDGVRVFTLAREDRTITCAKGLRVLPDECGSRRRRLTCSSIPAGAGRGSELGDEAVLDWIRGLAGDGALIDERLHRLARLRGRGPPRRPAGDDALGLARAAADPRPRDRVRPDDRFVDTGR